MLDLNQWLSKYAESHQNPKNQLIHKICVPLIVWSVLALAHSVPTLSIGSISIGILHFVILGAFIFYFRLGMNVGLSMLAMCSFLFLLVLVAEQTGFLWKIGLAVFVISWIFQFYGHKIEGKKPSFADDLKFLLVGPLWVLHYLKIL